MPIMDGYTATGKIRENGHFKTLPILAMTAGATVEDRERSLAAGMNAHLTKPIIPKELYAALLEWIQPAERTLPPLQDEGEFGASGEGPALPVIAGIDSAAGVARLGGNVKAYCKLLHKFAENQAHAMSEIRSALEQGDIEVAVRVAHTLKGVGGSVGAGELYRLGAELESTLKASPNADIESLLGQTGAELAHIIDAINTDSGSEELREQGGQEPLPADYGERLQQLAVQIEAYAGEATETLESLIDDVGDSQVREELRQLAKLVNRYEYDEALTMVSGMSP
jgi:two-component system sensor histidine kinase/response regulator